VCSPTSPLRALSPAVNDPTTASQALDTSDSLLRLLATRYIDVGCVRSSEGRARVILQLPTWDEYLGLAVDEVMVYGLASPQVRQRLERLLVELAGVVPVARHSAIEGRMLKLRALPSAASTPAAG